MQRRNFRFLGLALAGALALGTAACGDEVVIPEAAPTITLTPASITLNVGETATVVANVTNLEGATFTFTNSDATVASLTTSGSTATVKALKAGTTTITVTGTANGKTVQEAVQVRVNEGPVAPKATISLTPTTANLNVGQQLPIVAMVSNAANPALTWTSSAPAVATVDANGIVTGVAQGAALITAKLTADTTVKAVASITVNKVGGAAAINIGAIFNAAGQVANPANINGQISVQMNVTPGSTDSLRVFVDDQVISSCSRNFAGTSNDNQVVTCVINTNALDANGNAVFANGAHVINARLFGNGQVAATATSETLTFTNADQLNLQVTTVGVTTANGTTIGGDGLLWNEGNVVVTVTPAIFSGATGTKINAPQVCVFEYDNAPANTVFNANGAAVAGATQVACRTAVAGEGNAFTVTFPKSGTANTVAGITTNNFFAQVLGATTTAGQPFTGGTSNVIRLDNAAPVVGAVALPIPASAQGYLGGNFAFSFSNTTTSTPAQIAAATATGVADVAPGSNSVRVNFYAVATSAVAAQPNTAAGNGALIAGVTPVTAASQLENSLSNTAYTLIVEARDTAGNRTLVRGQAFGVDLDAPTTSLSDNSTASDLGINEGGQFFRLTFTDALSGPADNAYQFRIRRYTLNAQGQTVVECVTNPGANTFVPETSTAPCTFQAQAGSDILVPTAAGLYVFELRVIDRAGNVSSVITLSALNDVTAPGATASSLSFTDNTVSVSGTLTDNLDLASYDTRLQFGAAASATTVLPFGGMTQVGSYGLPLTGSASASGTSPIIRGLQVGLAGAPAAVTRVGFGALDVAGNFGFGSIGFSAPTNSDGIAGVTAFTLTPVATICQTGTTTACGTGAAAVPATRTIRAVATTAIGANQPFARVIFYQINPSAVEYSLIIGEATSASLETTATERVWTFSTTLNAANLAPAVTPTSNVQVFAVGIDADGDAVLIGPMTIDVL